MAEKDSPVMLTDLCTLLDVHEKEAADFSRRLAAMESKGSLLRNRRGAYILPTRASLVAGVVEGHPDGFGFLQRDDGEADIFLDHHQMAKVLHGDRVLARIIGVDRRGKAEGSIVEVTERANFQLAGRVHAEHGLLFVTAENKRISQNILIPPGKKGSKARNSLKAKTGQVVIVEIIEQPSKYAQPIGKIIEILGNYTDPGMEIEIALRKHELPFRFSKAVSNEVQCIPTQVVESDLHTYTTVKREDLSSLPLVTIDGETARDFDDAVYCQPITSSAASGAPRGRAKRPAWRLLVAIADVSHYVRPGMQLDSEALLRGNSVYFPRRVIPMLPEKLSNGICSLNPQQKRLVMACDMQISQRGQILSYRFFPAMICSQARLTYDTVWGWLSGSKKPLGKAESELQPHMHNLYTLYQILADARKKRGAIDFETVETELQFDEHGKIKAIVPVVRNDAHRIIEECMLAANVCASDFLHAHKHPAIYRIHEGPTSEKLSDLRSFLGEFGLSLGGGDTPQASDYATLLEKVKHRPDMLLLQTVMLRSLRQAVYSPENAGHFGLSYDAYTHFTSPIRRYPDLLIHRAIKACLAGKSWQPKGSSLQEIAIICSRHERRADEATRDVENWLKCYSMQDKIGECYDGVISGVTAFGVFVTLDDIYIDGLIHVSDLGDDYFNYDKIKHQMLGERSGQRYRLGDRVRIRVVRADLESGKIDFVLATCQDTRKATRSKRQPARRLNKSS